MPERTASTPEILPETPPLSDDELRRRWEEVVANPAFANLAYDVETDAYGKILMSPHTPRHSARQKLLQGVLEAQALEQQLQGSALPEYPVRTSAGVKQVDVVWLSEEEFRGALETEEASAARAPRLCVEVMSKEDTFAQIYEKRDAYVQAGAEEVWVVTRPGRLLFFLAAEPEEPAAASRLFPGVPDHIDRL